MNVFAKCFILNRLDNNLKTNSNSFKKLRTCATDIGRLQVIVQQISTSLENMIKQFPQQYHQLMNVQTKTTTVTHYYLMSYIISNKYQCKLWNCQHIVPFIFTFLDFDSLIRCSLVSSHWLYHALNVNSIEFVDLINNHLFIKCICSDSTTMFDKYRVWQRMTRVKRMRIDMSRYLGSVSCTRARNYIESFNGFHQFTRLKQLIILAVYPMTQTIQIWQKLSPFVMSNNGSIQMIFDDTGFGADFVEFADQVIDSIDRAISDRKIYLNKVKFIVTDGYGGKLLKKLSKKQSFQNQVEKIEFDFRRKNNSLDLCHMFFVNNTDNNCIYSILERRKKQQEIANDTLKHPIWSQIDSHEKFAQVGIVCGVAGKCNVGWRVDVDYPYIGPRTIAVEALAFRKKTKKLFLYYGDMRKYFQTDCIGGYHTLPNSRLCPPNTKYKTYNNFNCTDPERFDIDRYTYYHMNMMPALIQLKKLTNIDIFYKTKLVDLNMEWVVDALHFVVMLNAAIAAGDRNDCDQNQIDVVGLNMNVEIPGISDDNTTWNAMENIFKLVDQAIFAKIPLSIVITKKQSSKILFYTTEQLFQNSRNSLFQKNFTKELRKVSFSKQKKANVRYTIQLVRENVTLCLQVRYP